jgi:hypothetical protein
MTIIHHVTIHHGGEDTTFMFSSAKDALHAVMYRIFDFSDEYTGDLSCRRALKKAWDEAAENNDPGLLVDEWNDHEQLFMFSYSTQRLCDTAADNVTLPLFPFEH